MSLPSFFQVVPNLTWVTPCWHLPPLGPRTKWIQSKATRTSTKTKPKLLTKALFRARLDPTRSADVPCLIKLDLIKVSLKLWGVRNGWKWEFISLLRKCYYFQAKDPLSTNSWEFLRAPEPLKPAPKPHPVGQCKSCLHRIHLLVGHEPVYKLCSLEPPEIKQSFDHCVSLERHANSKLYQICKCVFWQTWP